MTHQAAKLIGDRASRGIFTKNKAGNGDYNK